MIVLYHRLPELSSDTLGHSFPQPREHLSQLTSFFNAGSAMSWASSFSASSRRYGVDISSLVSSTSGSSASTGSRYCVGGRAMEFDVNSIPQPSHGGSIRPYFMSLVSADFLGMTALAGNSSPPGHPHFNDTLALGFLSLLTMFLARSNTVQSGLSTSSTNVLNQA